MSLGIDPKVDFAFKLVFGSPDHTGITIHFLNAVLNLPQPITWVEILNPIQGQDRSEDKLVVLDVLARDAAGRHFNVEMQTTLPVDLTKRLTYYNSLNYVRQLSPGDAYYALRPAISICVLNRILFRESDLCHLSFRIRCDQDDLVFTDDLEFHTLELPKFKGSKTEIGQCSAVEKWLYFLRYAEEADPEQLVADLGSQEYKEAVGVLAMIARTPEERQFYEARQKFLHDEEARLIAARMEGVEQGLERGLEQGLEQGTLVGKIQMLQQLLDEAPSPVATLRAQSVSELAAMANELQERLRQRDA